jgi:hypothetical protein
MGDGPAEDEIERAHPRAIARREGAAQASRLGPHRGCALRRGRAVAMIIVEASCGTTAARAEAKVRDVPLQRIVVIAGALALLQGSASAAGVVLQPHIAVYDLTMVSTSGDRPVAGARGRIAFEFSGNACDGFVLNFRQVTQITDAEEGDRLFDARNSSWEDGEARSFRFDAERRMNNRVTEAGRGRAERADGDVLSIEIDRPSSKRSDVAGPVLFPTQQLIRIIGAAKAGERVFESRVFDGSDGTDKVYDTTAVIGAPIADGGEGLDDDLKRLGYQSLARWPVTISYFEGGAGERLPISIVSYDLLENGMTNRIRIDFGDFVMAGEPVKVEALKPSACDRQGG